MEFFMPPYRGAHDPDFCADFAGVGYFVWGQVSFVHQRSTNLSIHLLNEACNKTNYPALMNYLSAGQLSSRSAQSTWWADNIPLWVPGSFVISQAPNRFIDVYFTGM